MKTLVDAQWTALDRHFEHHVRVVERFRGANREAVLRMWTNRTNEAGKRLTQWERDALIERHCELFGTWPD